jgi:hypothetical protein
MPTIKYIYIGFDNIFRVDLSKRELKKYSLECRECDTIYKTIDANHDWKVKLILKTQYQ